MMKAVALAAAVLLLGIVSVAQGQVQAIGGSTTIPTQYGQSFTNGLYCRSFIFLSGYFPRDENERYYQTWLTNWHNTFYGTSWAVHGWSFGDVDSRDITTPKTGRYPDFSFLNRQTFVANTFKQQSNYRFSTSSFKSFDLDSFSSGLRSRSVGYSFGQHGTSGLGRKLLQGGWNYYNPLTLPQNYWTTSNSGSVSSGGWGGFHCFYSQWAHDSMISSLQTQPWFTATGFQLVAQTTTTTTTTTNTLLNADSIYSQNPLCINQCDPWSNSCNGPVTCDQSGMSQCCGSSTFPCPSQWNPSASPTDPITVPFNAGINMGAAMTNSMITNQAILAAAPPLTGGSNANTMGNGNTVIQVTGNNGPVMINNMSGSG